MLKKRSSRMSQFESDVAMASEDVQKEKLKNEALSKEEEVDREKFIRNELEKRYSEMEMESYTMEEKQKQSRQGGTTKKVEKSSKETKRGNWKIKDDGKNVDISWEDNKKEKPNASLDLKSMYNLFVKIQ